ncbi:MAG: S1/P1 nuclease [Cyclobacteriaceae bacterium]|nr:S1/P1 nuclease [Cyclobacteriaceae bacterium]
MKKPVLVMICFLILTNGFGWGVTGHRASGLIAERYLTKKARTRIQQILKGESLAMASTWMDEIRSDSTYNYTADWHWTTIPDGGRYEDVENNPDGKVIMMIEKFTKELKAGKLTAKQEVEYLKMLVHMVGDMHQPLHVGRPGDKGGNDIKVKWFRNDSNLHRVWDSEMIDDTRLSYTELAQSLGNPSKEEINKWQNSSVREWALESVSYRPQVYDIGNSNLSYPYSYKYLSLAKTRVLQAGVRLAGLLNQIYG